MKKLNAFFLAVALAFACVQAPAESRIRVEAYKPDHVYTVWTRVGMATLIQLQDGEFIDTTKTDVSVLGIGYGEAWTLGVRQNNFVLKPRKSFPDTNMLIVTNKRTYAFDLRSAKAKTPTTYVLAFSYPDDERKAEAERQNQIRATLAQIEADRAARQAIIDRDNEITSKARAKAVIINTDYNWRGNNADLVPTAAWDDGRFTHLEYNHAGSVPQFYKVLPDGKEALININVNTDEGQTNQIVLQEVLRVMRARLNDEVIEIVNHSFRQSDFNDTGTSTHGAVRIEKKIVGAE